MTNMIRIAAATIAVLLLTTAAEARHRHHHYRHAATHHRVSHLEAQGCVFDNNGRTSCQGSISGYVEPLQARRRAIYDANGNSAVIGGRPAGCPHAYCGCGLARYLGINDPRLNLAWNWTRYYHGSMAVAVWPHHVAGIERMTGRRTAIMIDFNGGHGLSYRHERSLAGARIVGGTQMALR